MKVMIIIFFLEYIVSPSKLYMQELIGSFVINDWQLLYKYQGTSSSLSSCGPDQILGGYQILERDSIVTKLFTLDPHSSIKITFDFWIIDNWQASDVIIVYIDESIVYWYRPANPSNGNICGDGALNDYKIPIEVSINHNFNSALLVIQTNLTTGYWGINNVKVYIEECPLGCQVCNAGEMTFQCISWALAYQELTEKSMAGFNIQGWQIMNSLGSSSQCSNIPLLCGLQLCANQTFVCRVYNLPNHSLVKVHVKFLKIDTWDPDEQAIISIDNTQILYTLGSQLGYQLCGQSLSYAKELLANLEYATQHSDSQLELIVKSNLEDIPLDESFGIRDVQIYLNNRCNYVYYYECCGDSIVQMGEECDDGNIIPFDGCYNCKYSCIDGCLLCINNQCIECQDNWIFINNQCYFINNNPIIINNSNNFRTIITTQNQSFLQKCQYAYNNICQQCNQEWYQCQITQQIYKDQIYDLVYITINFIQQTIICDDMCNICIQNQCLKCNQNYYLNIITNKCDSICGDYIQNYNEQCDDGNNYIYDGCVQCQLIQYNKCNDQCSFCYYSICQQCNYGYQLYNNECISICGDYLINKEIEECDNPNIDGCINCHIKYGYQCIQQDISICWTCNDYCIDCINLNNNLICNQCQQGYYLNNNQCLKCDNQCITCIYQSNQCIQYYIECNNNIGLYLNDQNNNCISKCGDGIIINEQCDDGNNDNNDGCSQDCQYEFIQQPIFNAYLDNFNQTTQIIILNFSQKVKRIINEGQFIDKINATIQNLPYNLTIKPITEANNKLNWVIYQIEVIIYENTNYKPKLQVELLEELYNQENLPLNNLLNILTLHNTFYISEEQIQSTQTLVSVHNKAVYSLGAIVTFLFFSGCREAAWATLELLQEQSYLRFINVAYPLNLEIYFNSSNIISFGPLLNYLDMIQYVWQFEYMQTGNKFKQYNINGNIVYNGQSLVLSLLGFFFIKITMKYCILILMYLKCAENSFTWAKFQRKLKFYIMELFRESKQEGYYRLLLSNTWDIIFMSFIDVFYVDNWILNVITIPLLLIIFIAIIQNFKGVKKYQNLKKYWDKKLDCFLLLKKLVFMIALIFCQRNQNLQIHIMSIINTSYFLLLMKLRIFSGRRDFIKTFITESLTIIFLLTTQLYCENTFIVLTANQKIVLGWFDIGLLLISLLCHLLFSSLEILQELISFFSSKKNTNQNVKNNEGNEKFLNKNKQKK